MLLHTTIVQGHAQEPISNSSAKSRHARLVLRRGTTVESRVSYVLVSPHGSILQHDIKE
jgi:aromatic ring-opening dioxygenase LigB subunit